MAFENEVIKRGSYYDFLISPTSTCCIGNNVTLRSFISIEVNNNAKLELGDNVYLNNYSSIRCFHNIKIGKNTMMGDGVRIYDFDHSYSSYHIGRISSYTAPVIIGSDTWIGANCVITKGVTIGNNVIVGAGTIVTKNIPDNSLVYSEKGLKIKIRKQNSMHAFTLTASDNIENIRYLLKKLPKIDFHIAAPTRVSSRLEKLGKEFSNCQVYPIVFHDYDIDKLLEKADFYLDINHGNEVDNIVSKVLNMNIKVLAFSNVCHLPSNEFIEQFDSKKPKQMVAAIKKLLKEKR